MANWLHSFAAWTGLVVRVGLTDPRLLARVPSRYMDSIYFGCEYR